MRRWIVGLVVALVPVVAFAGKPPQVESPPEGISPRTFATEYKGCLGPLRSALARDPGFDADFNPGKHQGTVGEEEFLKNLLGIGSDEELSTFCSAFE